jgi:hypothetical protein
MKKPHPLIHDFDHQRADDADNRAEQKEAGFPRTHEGAHTGRNLE